MRENEKDAGRANGSASQSLLQYTATKYSPDLEAEQAWRLQRIAALIRWQAKPKTGLSRAEINERETSLRALRHASARYFGERRGWRLSDRGFGAVTLRDRARWRCERRGFGLVREWELDWPFGDHSFYYRREARAAAIVAHLYGLPVHLEEWAQAHGVRVNVLPMSQSWWYPGACFPVLYRPSRCE